MHNREDLLDLNDVLQHPGRHLSVDVTTELSEEEDLDLVKPLEGFLEAISTGNLLLITGKFSTLAVFECARCMGPIEVDVEFEVDEQFPVVGVPSALSHQDFAKVDPSDEPFPMFEGNSLMVEALLRQNLLLNFPVQPLCEYGWEGECPNDVAKDARLKKITGPFSDLHQLSQIVEEGDE
ncbi:MAG TPA: YceD family protein [Fimbriimonas sp.]|nr:YceD family protein [Fimbriimonas sp.]